VRIGSSAINGRLEKEIIVNIPVTNGLLGFARNGRPQFIGDAHEQFENFVCSVRIARPLGQQVGRSRRQF